MTTEKNAGSAGPPSKLWKRNKEKSSVRYILHARR